MLYGDGDGIEFVSVVKSRDVKSKREGDPVRETKMGVLMEPSLSSSPPDVQFVNDALERINSSSSLTFTSITLPFPAFRWIPMNPVL